MKKLELKILHNHSKYSSKSYLFITFLHNLKFAK